MSDHTSAEDVATDCKHEWETVDEGGGASEFQPPDPRVEQCILCGRRREGNLL